MRLLLLSSSLSAYVVRLAVPWLALFGGIVIAGQADSKTREFGHATFAEIGRYEPVDGRYIGGVKLINNGQKALALEEDREGFTNQEYLVLGQGNAIEARYKVDDTGCQGTNLAWTTLYTGDGVVSSTCYDSGPNRRRYLSYVGVNEDLRARIEGLRDITDKDGGIRQVAVNESDGVLCVMGSSKAFVLDFQDPGSWLIIENLPDEALNVEDDNTTVACFRDAATKRAGSAFKVHTPYTPFDPDAPHDGRIFSLYMNHARHFVGADFALISTAGGILVVRKDLDTTADIVDFYAADNSPAEPTNSRRYTRLEGSVSPIAVSDEAMIVPLQGDNSAVGLHHVTGTPSETFDNGNLIQEEIPENFQVTARSVSNGLVYLDVGPYEASASKSLNGVLLRSKRNIVLYKRGG